MLNAENHFYWQQPSAPVFDSEGRIQPLNCKKGDVANNIISVGDPNRAAKFKECFDEGSVKVFVSNMIYVIYTGTYKGVPISVIATGMGFAMVDLLVIQIRAITEGPLTIIRFGTCGSLHAEVPIGSYVLTSKAYSVSQSYENDEFPYHISKVPYPMDEKLNKLLLTSFQTMLPQYKTYIGSCFSADTFYGSQGRQDDSFINNNQTIIPKILEIDPEATNFEMEAYIFAFLAAKFPEAQIKTAAICITLAQRTNGDFLSNEVKYDMEQKATAVLFETLIHNQKEK